MPQFFIHLENDQPLSADEQNGVYDTADRAINDLARTAGAVLTDDIAAGRSQVRIVGHVIDGDGRRIAALTVEAALDRSAA